MLWTWLKNDAYKSSDSKHSTLLANFYKSLVNKQHNGTIQNLAVAVEMITLVWSCLLSFIQILFSMTMAKRQSQRWIKAILTQAVLVLAWLDLDVGAYFSAISATMERRWVGAIASSCLGSFTTGRWARSPVWPLGVVSVNWKSTHI